MDTTKLKIVMERKKGKELLEDNPYFSEEAIVRRIVQDRIRLSEDDQSLSDRIYSTRSDNSLQTSVNKNIMQRGITNLNWGKQETKGGFDI